MLVATKPSMPRARATAQGTVQELDFCTLIRQPYRFKDQTFRIKAKWEFAGESGFLDGFHCRGDYIERLGTTFAKDQDEAVKWNVSRARSPEFGGRAMITVVGAVRDTSPGDGPKALRFEIFRFEDIAPLEKISDVDFCEILKEPGRFFNQTVRIKASWSQGHEFSYLNGVNCQTKSRSDIAVGWVNGRDPAIVAAVEKLLSHEYGERGIITTVGTLRNPGKNFGFYRYQFQILRIEDVQHVIEPYQAKLQAGYTYRAVVRGDKKNLLVLVPPLPVHMNYTAHIKWLNFSEFRELGRLYQVNGERTIIFSVIRDELKQIDEQRWDRWLDFKIIRVAQNEPHTNREQSAQEEVRDIDFCEIVKEPQQFFNQLVRIKAKWVRGIEFWFLRDNRCPSGLRQNISVGIYDHRTEAANVQKLLSREYGGRAMVTVVGRLLDKEHAYYRYRFQVLRIEDVQHVITPYEGTLETGKTYRAVVRGDKEIELRLVPPLHIEMHYSAGIDWTNLSDFPVLEELHKTRGERTIVFSVMSDVRRQMTEWRWSRILETRIVRIE